ncbi:MAG: hypothetical protein OXI24_16275 [Candidatus Poribacteria bacterium]|nr:hypothetical protein [Candidatus Poribacteria bacterium]
MQYSIVNYSEVIENTDFRLSAEYYHPICLEIHRKIKNNGGISFFKCITKFSAGKNLPQVKNGNFKFIRTQNIKPILVNDNGMSYTNILDELTEIGELLFVRVGAGVGNSSIVTPNSVNSTVSDNILRIKIRGLNPFFLCCFFNSTVGQTYFSRVFKGTARGLISRENFRDIFIPQFSHGFQSLIEKLCLEADSLHEQSGFKYHEAQTLLLAELGLADWQPKQQLTFVKNFSDTERTGRIDAEYFQPKYDDIVDAIKNYSGSWDTLENLARVKDTNFNPDAEIEYQYIELANIGNSGEITDCMVEHGEDLPTRARRKVAAGDVIVSSIEGSLESIALITEEYDNALCSTGFHVVQSDVLNSKVLLVLLKSIVGQLQLKKGCNGTILTAINKAEFSRIAIPKITEDKQAEVEQKVIEFFNLHNRAKDLLEHAKHAVEIAIEQDEETAINWLESVT